MRRILVNLAGAVAIAVAIFAVAELTQSRSDHVPRDSVTSVRFDVATRRSIQREEDAASALWQVCAHATVSWKHPTPPVRVGDVYEAEIRPAVGEHGRRRLVGCLEDTTIDRVLGHVLWVRSRIETTTDAARRARD